MTEVWIKVNLNGRYYEISNLGGVKNVKTQKILKKTSNGRGYYQLVVNNKNQRKVFYVHRIVATLFVPNPYNYKIINHINGNKSDNCFTNLEWTTSSENTKHAYKIGLISKGNKLNKEDVEYIRNSTLSKKELSKKFQVTLWTINDILKRKTWK